MAGSCLAARRPGGEATKWLRAAGCFGTPKKGACGSWVGAGGNPTVNGAHRMLKAGLACRAYPSYCMSDASFGRKLPAVSKGASGPFPKNKP
jgi:hypothetical protein